MSESNSGSVSNETALEQDRKEITVLSSTSHYSWTFITLGLKSLRHFEVYFGEKKISQNHVVEVIRGYDSNVSVILDTGSQMEHHCNNYCPSRHANSQGVSRTLFIAFILIYLYFC